MTIEKIKQEVNEISKMAQNNEIAHVMEDDLWEKCLTEIANGCKDPKKLTQEALKTSCIKFDRWYA